MRRLVIDIDEEWLDLINLGSHLKDSSWTPELECALEKFSLPTYLDYLDQFDVHDGLYRNLRFPEYFFEYLEHNVSIPCIQTKCQLQLLILIRKNLNFFAIMPHFM